MRYIFPHYFDRFRCSAAECTDSCCAGSSIMIDEDSLARYRQLPGAFGDQVRASIDWEEGSFLQCDGHCVFLNDDHLCEMHLAAGEQMLCDTCTNYPRHMEEYEGLREGSLTMSCIEAAKIILGCTQPVQFLVAEDDREDEEYEDFDYLLFTKLMDARKVLIGILQNRDVDITWRMVMALDLTEQIQKAFDDGELYRIDDLLEQAKIEDALLQCQKKYRMAKPGDHVYYSSMRKYMRIFKKLEVLKKDWTDYLKRAEWAMFGNGQASYEQHIREFHRVIETEHYDTWSVCMEQLMVYFVFVYFCGAVYDDKILEKMQFAVLSTMLIRELIFVEWMENGKILQFDDILEAAHRYSREVEHSDNNLIRMEKLLGQEKMFTVTHMISMLLHHADLG